MGKVARKNADGVYYLSGSKQAIHTHGDCPRAGAAGGLPRLLTRPGGA